MIFLFASFYLFFKSLYYTYLRLNYVNSHLKSNSINIEIVIEKIGSNSSVLYEDIINARGIV
ncbi:hypothetical protein ATH_1146 [Aliarcobacter thereius LMG 24486]|nr:hypothetical protein ATH_1146 [Aliarcobacter thereius LMG 24486]